MFLYFLFVLRSASISFDIFLHLRLSTSSFCSSSFLLVVMYPASPSFCFLHLHRSVLHLSFIISFLFFWFAPCPSLRVSLLSSLLPFCIPFRLRSYLCIRSSRLLHFLHHRFSFIRQICSLTSMCAHGCAGIYFVYLVLSQFFEFC